MFSYCVITTLAVSLYLHGFFPIPSRTVSRSANANFTEVSPTFKRAVIVVIDALRLDFVTPGTTPFLSKTIKSNGCFVKLKVETPTVTLPRIKALTIGHVSQFIDIIINLASPTKVEDSFIQQAHLKRKNIVFYGDDIWLKLFPSYFLRSEGTSSFYVNDFKEVDDNVTRNVKQELHRSDWDIMILHYLGLDHIGHVFGPKSHLILPKLKEMDDIIEELYNNLQETLFLVTGDHGMRDSGGHGGSTFSETNVPLVVLGIPCLNDTFSQVDIPVHLAILLGFKVPITSIGRLHASLLNHLPLVNYLDALKYNTLFLVNKMNICKGKHETAVYFHDLYLATKNDTFGYEAANLYQNCSKLVSEELLKSSVKQNMGSLILSTLTITYVMVNIINKICNTSTKFTRLEQVVIVVMLFLQFVSVTPIMTVIFSITIFLIIMNNIRQCRLKFPKGGSDLYLAGVMLILHPLSFLSSSFLEEEHQFWYYFGGTFLLINLINTKHLSPWILMFIVLRFIRTINQVGDKWSSFPDTADWLLKNENYVFLQALFVCSLGLTYYCNFMSTVSRCNSVFDGIILFLVFIYKVLMNESIILGQILWLLIFLKCLYCLLKCEDFLTVWILISSLLLKPYNTILIPVCMLASGYFHKNLNTNMSVIAHWWIGNLLFFCQGHDNSLASVDISSGYVGLKSYDPLLVIPQVLCHTYAFQVMSHLLLFRNKCINVEKYLSLFVLIRIYIIAVVFIVMFIQRHHLFIWSVFAPKIFIEASHLIFLLGEVCSYSISTFVTKYFC